MNNRLRKLDVSYNRLNRNCDAVLRQYLYDRFSNLYHLNLEGNALGDLFVRNLFAEKGNKSLRLAYLNLSKNELTTQACLFMRGFLRGNSELNELYLHYNKIDCEGGNALAQLVRTNQLWLKVLDLSSNSLGRRMKNHQQSTTREWEELFRQTENKSLLHLDLSHNQFGFEDTKTLSASLVYNHTIMGFHFRGNHGTVDSVGHLTPTEELQRVVSEERIDSVRVSAKGFRSNCWVCEGWVEHEFRFRPHGLEENSEVFILLSFDGYRPRKLTKTDYHRIRVMCPPKRDIYYIFYQDERYKTAQDLPRERLDAKRLKKYALSNDLRDSVPKYLNVLLIPEARPVISSSYVEQVVCVPRDGLELLYRVISKPQFWHYEGSLFKNYKRDTPALLDECFEYDWNQTKLQRLYLERGKEEFALLKKIMRENYELVKLVYKYYASLSPAKDVWSISQGTFSYLLQLCGIGKLPQSLKSPENEEDQ